MEPHKLNKKEEDPSDSSNDTFLLTQGDQKGQSQPEGNKSTVIIAKGGLQ